MRLIKRFFSIMLAFMLVLSGLFMLPIDTYAIPTERQNDMLLHSATKASAYLMACQPDDAIILTDAVTIKASDISDNYMGGIVELPRLTSEYYYQLSGNSDYLLLETVYPALAFKTAAIGTEVTLSIRNRTTMNTQASFTITVVNDGSIVAGYDTIYGTTPVTDCAANVLTGLIDSGYTTLNKGPISVYNHALHKTSIVMDEYILSSNPITAEDITGDFSDITQTSYSIDDNAYLFSREDVGMSGIRTSYNVKDYIGTLNSAGGLRTGVLAVGSKMDADNIFDGNTGLVQTRTLATDVGDLYYVIALSTGLYVGKVTTTSVDADAFSKVSETAPTMSWSPKTFYSLESGSRNAGYTTTVPTGYNKYGPISFDKWWATAASGYGLTLRSGMYQFQHESASTIKNFNVYAETLIYAGCIPHLGTATIQEVTKAVTINYHFKKEGDSNFTNAGMKTVANADWSTYNLMTPTLSPGCELDGWYTDNTLKSKFDKASYTISGVQELDLYGSEKYTGGMYNVTYYNDQTHEDISQNSYKIAQQPTPPSVKSKEPGYSFHGWIIVEKKGDSSGDSYVPGGFRPVNGKNYIFQTAWDTTGIISNVQTNKEHFYVGDTVEKKDLRVYVIDTSGGTPRLLTDAEYNLDNVKLDKAGTHQFVVTYLKTGAMATTTITVEDVTVIEIDAKYTGGAIAVGSEVPVKAITLTATYNNGTKRTIKDFTVSPKTIQSPGDNSVTVTYEDKSVNVIIKGKTSTKKKTLKKLKASWVGESPTVGDTLNPVDLLVVATYEGGAEENIDYSEYKYSPSKFKTAGKNTVSVTYGGKKTSCRVTVKAKPSPATDDYPTTKDKSTKNSKDTSSSSKGGSSTRSKKNKSKNRSKNKSDASDGKSATDALTDLIKSVTDPDNSRGSSSSNNTSSSSGHQTTVDQKPKDITESASNTTDVASPLYLSGATILTNTMTTSTAVSNTVDVAAQLDDAAENSEVNIFLVNGASGNDITEDMLKKIESKGLKVNIHMLATSNEETVVATWKISGKKLDDIKAFNPNIVFEVVDRSADRLVYFTTSSTSFPKGIKLIVSPESDAYASGSLIRWYETDLAKSNSKLSGTLHWKDANNEIEIDLDNPTSYVLSDSMESYPDGSNFGEAINDMDINDSVAPNDDASTDVVEEDSSEVKDNQQDAPVEQPTKKTSPVFIILLVLGALLLLGGAGILLKTLLSRGSKPKAQTTVEVEADVDVEPLDEGSDEPVLDTEQSDIPEPIEPEQSEEITSSKDMS